jgi:23S rRNA pseudouridine2605 synthase
VERTYVATVRGDVRAAVVAARRGVELEDGFVQPRAVEARPLGNRTSEFEVTIAEGRNREVRRFCEALGLEVERLVRVRFGPVVLGRLETGATRGLSVREQHELERLLERPLALHAPPERSRRSDARPRERPRPDARRDASHERPERRRRKPR